MSDVHTNTETVKQLVAALENGGVWSTGMQMAATTLRALLAERDDARMCADAEAEAANEFKAERDRLAAEVASLRLTLGGRTFSASVPEPIGCPLPGACATVAEIVRLRKALRQIRDLGLGPDRGSAQWQIGAANEIARAALAGEGRDD